MSSINTWARLYSLTAVHPRDGTLLPAHQISREYRESLHTTLLKELSDSILLRSSSASDSCSPIIRIHSFILSSKLCLVADLAFMVGVVLIFLESIDKKNNPPDTMLSGISNQAPFAPLLGKYWLDHSLSAIMNIFCCSIFNLERLIYGYRSLANFIWQVHTTLP